MKCNYKRNLKNTAEAKLTKEQEKAIAFYLDMYSFLLKEYYDEKNKRLKNEEDFFNSFYQLIIDENQTRQEDGIEGYFIFEQTGQYEAIFYDEMLPEETKIVSKNAKELIDMGARIFCALNCEFAELY